MDNEILMYGQQFVTDWLNSNSKKPELKLVQFYTSRENSDIVLFNAKFNYNYTEISFINSITENTSYFDSNLKKMDMECYENVFEYDYNELYAKHLYESTIPEEYRNGIIMPGDVDTYSFTKNVDIVIFDNFNNSIYIYINDTEGPNKELFKMGLEVYK